MAKTSEIPGSLLLTNVFELVYLIELMHLNIHELIGFYQCRIPNTYCNASFTSYKKFRNHVLRHANMLTCD